ncbi:HAD-IA family hydrolase [Alloiococcus sp. CFN-8]|uniref:HAD-IA family hydrolase n=1 Tax=Alloiococcus sp. CFN-8 TaxID=3416081 RepID=UPI003CF93C54
MKYKAVIWDFDGTLFDTYPVMVKAFKEALAKRGYLEAEEQILKHMKVSVREAINHYTALYDLDKDFPLDYVRGEEVKASEALPFPFAREVCQGIIASGGRNYIVTHRSKTSAEKYLMEHSMMSLFTEIVGKENGFKRKPDPGAYHYILNKYSLGTEEVLIVGDREFEAKAAEIAGIHCCLFDSNNVLRITKTEYYIKELSELMKILHLVETL